MPKKPLAKAPKKRGAPTKWSPELNDRLIAFFDREPTLRELVAVTTHRDGSEREEYKTVPNKVPFLSAFERKEGIAIGLLSRWAAEEEALADKKEPEKRPGFLQAFKAAKELQTEFLFQGAASGVLNASTTIFGLKNMSGWRDSYDQRFVDRDGNDREGGVLMYPAAKHVT